MYQIKKQIISIKTAFYVLCFIVFRWPLIWNSRERHSSQGKWKCWGTVVSFPQ